MAAVASSTFSAPIVEREVNGYHIRMDPLAKLGFLGVLVFDGFRECIELKVSAVGHEGVEVRFLVLVRLRCGVVIGPLDGCLNRRRAYRCF